MQSINPGQLPLLAGLSRKRMIQNVVQRPAEECLNGTTILNTLALQNGASILRVHDVKEAVECVRLWSFYKERQQRKRMNWYKPTQ